MRLIDADALKNMVPDTRVDIFENCRNCALLTAEDVLRLIDRAPTASEWVSENDKPPQSGERYLTVGARGVMRVAKAYVPAQVMPNWGGAADYHWWECEGKRCSVTHYMQLPAKPEGSAP